MLMQRPRGVIVLAGAIIALILTGCFSYFVVVDLPFWLARSDWITLHIYHGRLRVFWIRSYVDPIDVVSYHEPVRIHISPRPAGESAASSRGGYPAASKHDRTDPLGRGVGGRRLRI